MPTVNPRVNVTLSPSLDSLVVRLAGLQEVSKSQVLRELLEVAEPALQRAVALMEAAAKAKGSVLDGLARSLSQAQDTIEGQLSEHLAGLDAVTADLVTQAEEVRGRRRRSGQARSRAPGGAAPAGASTPVPVTRGSGGGKTLTRGQSKGGRRGAL